jgi:hypothetical protein
MSLERGRIALALSVAALMAFAAFEVPSAIAQVPPNNLGAGQGKANAGK